MEVPAEIIDEITLQVERGQWDSEKHGEIPWDTDDDSRWYKVTSYNCDEALAVLRLVNKAFCQSASRRLFQHIRATFDGAGDEIRITRLRELSNSPYATYVRQLNIGLASYDGSVEPAFYAEALAESLSPCLAKFPNLRGLDLVDAGLINTPEAKSIVLSSVISALRYVNMPALEELVLEFPLTYDFGQLPPSEFDPSLIPISNVIGRLRHLSLHVTEETEPSHQELEHQHFQVDEPLEYYDFPNQTNAANLFSLISLAINIRSLSIYSLNALDLDYVLFPSPLRLRTLSLFGLAVSAETLTDLVARYTTSIRFIEFGEMILKSGTWRHVLLHISKITTLVECGISRCGYSLAGTSARLHPDSPPNPPSLTSMESLDPRDHAAVAVLQHHVNRNRTALGLPKMPSSDFRAAEQTTLESTMPIVNRDEET